MAGEGRSGWHRLGVALAWGVLLGFAIAWVASALGLPASAVYTAWFVGGALSLVSLVLLFFWGVAEVCRRLFGGAPRRDRRTGPAAAAPAAPVPGPGWTGWRIGLDGVEHDVWVSPDDRPVFVRDAGRFEPDLVRTRRYGRPHRAFDIAGHPARLVPGTDWGATARGAAILAPVLVVLALLDGGPGSGGGGSLPTRWRLVVDGHEVPDTKRLRAGPTTAPDSRPKPPRTLHAEPPDD